MFRASPSLSNSMRIWDGPGPRRTWNRQASWVDLLRQKLMLCQLWSSTKFRAAGRRNRNKKRWHLANHFFPVKARKVPGIQGNGQVRQHGRWACELGQESYYKLRILKLFVLWVWAPLRRGMENGRQKRREEGNHQKVRDRRKGRGSRCVKRRKYERLSIPRSLSERQERHNKSI